jgi:hypothetical protein
MECSRRPLELVFSAQAQEPIVASAISKAYGARSCSRIADIEPRLHVQLTEAPQLRVSLLQTHPRIFLFSAVVADRNCC